jgi:uncharacterized membrane protein (DUF2068 family)
MERMHADSSQRGLLPYIAAFKLLKAILLVAVGAAMLRLINPHFADVVERWLAHLGSPLGRHLVQEALTRVLRLKPGQLAALGVGAWLYAILFAVEGVGLWRERRWAEFLTIGATASLIPLEIYEIVQKVSAARISALVMNAAIIVYLVARVRKR